MDAATSTLGNVTGIMIVQSTIPVTFVARADLGVVQEEKRKGCKDEPLPDEDVAGHRRLREHDSGNPGGGQHRQKERIRDSSDPRLARCAYTPRTCLREERASAAGPRDPRQGGKAD